jgi:hypothetical protein
VAAIGLVSRGLSLRESPGVKFAGDWGNFEATRGLSLALHEGVFSMRRSAFVLAIA